MLIKATEEQIKQMLVNAINASSPIGLGFLQADIEETYTIEDIQTITVGGHKNYKSIRADYFKGRMVKLCFEETEENLWNVVAPYSEPQIDYQSWARTYSTMQSLIDSVLK